MAWPTLPGPSHARADIARSTASTGIGCCAGCRHLFSSDTAFNAHRRGGQCLDPRRSDSSAGPRAPHPVKSSGPSRRLQRSCRDASHGRPTGRATTARAVPASSTSTPSNLRGAPAPRRRITRAPHHPALWDARKHHKVAAKDEAWAPRRDLWCMRDATRGRATTARLSGSSAPRRKKRRGLEGDWPSRARRRLMHDPRPAVTVDEMRDRKRHPVSHDRSAATATRRASHAPSTRKVKQMLEQVLQQNASKAEAKSNQSQRQTVASRLSVECMVRLHP